MPAIQGIQILLAVVVLILTGLLVFIGIQVIFILKDTRKAVKKANRVLDKQSLTLRDKSSEQISTPSFLSQLIGVKSQVISQNKVLTDDVAPRGSENPFIHIQALQERGREMFSPRVFHRQGKPLSKQ